MCRAPAQTTIKLDIKTSNNILHRDYSENGYYFITICSFTSKCTVEYIKYITQHNFDIIINLKQRITADDGE
jgi:hypothetical protein